MPNPEPQQTADLDDDRELIEDFLAESREALEVVDDALLSLESSPGDGDLVREVFRRVHSVKGASGFLGFERVESLSHAGESLLARVRDGELEFSEDIASALMAMVDALREIFLSLDDTGTEGTGDHDELVERLRQLREGDPTAEAAGGEAPDRVTHLDRQVAEGDRLAGRVLVDNGALTDEQLNQALAHQQAGDDRPLGEILVELGHIGVDQLREALGTAPVDAAGEAPATEPSKGSPRPQHGETSVRVDIDLLDSIVGLVGELVLTRNQMVQSVDESAEVFSRQTQDLAYITSALQEQALRTRMQRIETAWRSLPRVVRDVSKAAGKRAQVEMTGEGIELDRTIIESIRDPLVHLVRNAVDHGLEPSDERAELGKDPVGTIRLSAVQDGGHVIIEVSDDGRGIDPQKVAASAVEKRLVTTAQVAEMTESEMVELILLPGFSTAAEVTKISGRGVGMDVVASNIKQIRGSLEISSEPGAGTVVRLAIPLTLAIVPALVVTCCGEVFAVPQANVVELVRLQGADMDERIERIHHAPVLRLRERLLPLIELTSVLDLPPQDDRTAATIIVVQSGDQPFGLVVEGVTKAEEIVVKPVSNEVQSVGVYGGATVMGDGSAALILDVAAIARRSNLASGAQVRGPGGRAKAGADDRPRLLTVAIGDRRAGLLTTDLERLEKIDPTDVELAGNDPVVQYRGRLLPLVFLGQALDGHAPCLDRGPLRVVVTSERAAVSVGIVVDEVLDVVEFDPGSADQIGGLGRDGVLGSIVAGGAVTELLDIPSLVGRVETGPIPGWSPDPDPDTDTDTPKAPLTGHPAPQPAT